MSAEGSDAKAKLSELETVAKDNLASVAAILGSALGVFYGWMGAESLLGDMILGSTEARLVPTVPWLELAGVVAVAVVAGLLASVGPSRRAARLSPVEGLAVL